MPKTLTVLGYFAVAKFENDMGFPQWI